MAKFFVIVFLTVLALQGNLAKPKQTKVAEKSALEELVENTQNLVNNVTQTLDIPDSKKIVKDLNENTQILANHVQEIVNKIKEEFKAHQGDAGNVVNEIEKKLKETVTNLQQAVGPEATAKAKDLKKKLDDGLKTSTAQVEKLIKAVEPDVTKAKASIDSAAQTFLNQIAEVSNNIQNQVKATIAEHEKTHKNKN